MEYDYSKYLGEGYSVPKEANTIISNHSGVWDSVFLWSRRFPMFLAKKEVLKYPIFSLMIRGMQGIFIDRSADQKTKDKYLEIIAERQR